MLKRVLRALAYSPLPPVLLAVTLVFSEYQKNLSEVYPQELLIPLLAAIIIGTLPFLLYRFAVPASRRLLPLLASLLVVPVLYEYDTRLNGFISVLNYLHVYPPDWLSESLFVGLLIGAAGFLSYLVAWLLKRFHFEPLSAAKFILIVVAVGFTYGAIGTGTRIAKLLPQLTQVKQPSFGTPAKAPASKPDIYYIVLEDYPNNETLKALYNYDNSPFLNFLTSQGFTVNNNAYANYPYTSDSIPSTLQMNYLTNVSAQFKNAKSTELPMRAIFDNPPVASELKKMGYQYLNIGSWWTDTREIPAADTNYTDLFKVHILGYSATLSEFDIDILDHSFFGRLLGVNNSDPAHIVQYQLQNLHQLAKSSTQGGRFIFGHIILPHAPFVFMPDGSTPTYNQFGDDHGVTEEQKYVNQMLYINSQTESLIKDIKAHAKTPPVIILQSDEGPHPREMDHNDDELAGFDLNTLSDQKLRQKYGVLAAYDLPGATPDQLAQITSPVNTFRVVLDHYFGYNLPVLPDCSYAMRSRSKVFDFVDVTARLRGSEDPACTTIHQ